MTFLLGSFSDSGFTDRVNTLVERIDGVEVASFALAAIIFVVLVRVLAASVRKLVPELVQALWRWWLQSDYYDDWCSMKLDYADLRDRRIEAGMPAIVADARYHASLSWHALGLGYSALRRRLGAA